MAEATTTTTTVTQAKLNTLLSDFIIKNPNSKTAFTQAHQVVAGGTTRSVLNATPFPLVLQSGSGCSVTSVDGHTYIDFISDFSAGLYGHSHPVISQAISDAVATGFSLGGVIEKEAELGRILCDRFPSIQRVRFCNSGTEANMFAVGVALAFTGRKKVLVFENGYHGGTISFSTTSNNPLNLPHDFVVGKYNDIEGTQPLIDERIGAILIEPMQAAGGMRPSSRPFLSFLREAATRVGAVLIFDEVVTSRFHFHGLQGEWNVIPDMTTLGKYIGGGFSFGAFGGCLEIMNLFDPTHTPSLSHSGTFNNNIFTMTAAVAASELVTEESLARINELGARIRHRGNEMVQQAGFTEMQFTGYGSAVGVHFHGDEGLTLRDAFYFYLLQHGMLIGRRGFLSLNLLHTDVLVESLLGVVRGFIEEFSQI